MKAYQRASALAAVLLASPWAECFQLPASHRASISSSSKAPTRLFSTVEDKKSESTPSEIESSSSSFDPASAFTDTSSKFLGDPIPYSELTVGVLKETYPGENRVSVAPESAKLLVDAGLSVVVESGGEWSVLMI